MPEPARIFLPRRPAGPREAERRELLASLSQTRGAHQPGLRRLQQRQRQRPH